MLGGTETRFKFHQYLATSLSLEHLDALNIWAPGFYSAIYIHNAYHEPGPRRESSSLSGAEL